MREVGGSKPSSSSKLTSLLQDSASSSIMDHHHHRISCYEVLRLFCLTVYPAHEQFLTLHFHTVSLITSHHFTLHFHTVSLITLSSLVQPTHFFPSCIKPGVHSSDASHPSSFLTSQSYCPKSTQQTCQLIQHLPSRPLQHNGSLDPINSTFTLLTSSYHPLSHW